MDAAGMCAAMIIVGLHFLGLISAFRSRLFAPAARAFCVLGVVPLFLPVDVWTPVLSLGCAVLLWLGVTPLALRLLGQLQGRHASH